MARITLISRNFPPLTGGMERLFQHIYQQLACEHDIALIGPAGCAEHVDADCEVRPLPVTPTVLFLLRSFLSGLLMHRRTMRPAAIVGGSGLVGPVVVLLARLAGARSILLLHGLDIVADSRIYRRLFLPFARKADRVICNSRNTARLAINAGVDEQRITIIHPGVDLPAEVPAPKQARQQLGLPETTVLLSLGRLIPRKGLAEFIARSFAGLAADDPGLLLLVAGTEPASSLNDRNASVRSEIESAVAAAGLGERVRLLGYVDNDEATLLYAAADVFVFPLVETPGDVEGFGMVAIEAAACGTPTVAFNCGGVADAIADGETGVLVTPGCYDEFSAAIRRAARADMRTAARQFATSFSWDNYGQRLRACVDEVIA